MPSYDFTTLSPLDFEHLVRDLLQGELGIHLESFKAGRDGGIDLRYAPDARRSLIVQCKHYAASGYSTLFRHLKVDELPKVKRLRSTRYILATSVALTPDSKDRLRRLFRPYVRSPGDIFGRDDLNNLLGKQPDVERAHLKLYLSTVVTLERVLHADVYNRSSRRLREAYDLSQVYVPNESFGKALKILEETSVCIITGTPGIGKTTLAFMLVLYYAARGFEFVDITSDVSEVDAVGPDRARRVYLFDDFLGQTSIVEKLAQNADDRLVRFIRHAQRRPDIRFILTTRDYILQHARHVYEKLDRAALEPLRFMLDMTPYTAAVRAQILYNHLHFSDIPDDYKSAICRKEVYDRIIRHPNYNPRLIEKTIRLPMAKTGSREEFVASFFRILSTPDELWRHPFEHQLDEYAQRLLLVLATLPLEVDLRDFKTAADSFTRSHGQWVDTLRLLEGTFLRFEVVPNTDGSTITLASLHNPSLRDYLLGTIDTSELWVNDLLVHARFFEQVRALWSYANPQLLSFYRTSPHLAGLLRTLQTRPPCLGQAAIRTFESAVCDLHIVHTGSPPCPERYKPACSLERRLSEIIEIHTAIAGAFDLAWIRAQLQRLRDQWRKNLGDKPGALTLTRTLDTAQFTDALSFDDLKLDLGTWFATTLKCEDDYDALISLAAYWPGLLARVRSSVDVEAVHAWLDAEVASIWANRWGRDLDDEVSRLMKVAEILELDGLRGEYIEFCHRIREYRDDGSDVDPEPPSDRLWWSRGADDEDGLIDSMFESLRSSTRS